jgi:hypothetical protein
MNDFVYKKYYEFYKKNGYIPEMFNPYNTAEITDVAPCLSTQCGSTTTSAAVLIIEKGGITMEHKKKIVFERTPISQIIAISRIGNFYEVIGKVGGDVLTYRIYDNGTICEE